MPITVPFTGGCACSAVRYECSTEPILPRNCHCRDCQRAAGGPYAPLLSVPVDALRITERALRYADTQGNSGNTVSRGFCTECGCTVVGRAEAFPEIVSVVAASLDDPSWFRPAFALFTSSAQPWDFLDPEVRKFETMPTPEELQGLLVGG